MNEPNEPNVQPEDNPQPQGEGEVFTLVAQPITRQRWDVFYNN